jgi:hypothetical protein
MRLETIGYRLATANADTCAKPVMRSGLVLHDLAGYDQDQRARIGRDYDVTYGFGILGIVPGSTGDLADLQSRDEILAVNGSDLADYQPNSFGKKASFARTGAFTDFLAEKLAQGPVTLLVRRGTDRLSLSLGGLPGCGGYVSTVKSGIFNAWSDGGALAVTTHLIHYTADDSELAFIVAHEMSHNILGHNENARSAHLSSLIAIFGIGSARMRQHEIAADQFAIHLLSRTAYDKHAATALLTRLNRNVLMKLNVDFSHPTLGYRIALTRAAIASEEANGVASTIALASAPINLPKIAFSDRFDPLSAPLAAGLDAMNWDSPGLTSVRFGRCMTVAPISAPGTAMQPNNAPERQADLWWSRTTAEAPVDPASTQMSQIIDEIRRSAKTSDEWSLAHKPD